MNDLDRAEPPVGCLICRFEAEAEDQMVRTVTGRYICLRCWLRELGDEHPMPRRLRQEVQAAVSKEA